MIRIELIFKCRIEFSTSAGLLPYGMPTVFDLHEEYYSRSCPGVNERGRYREIHRNGLYGAL